MNKEIDKQRLLDIIIIDWKIIAILIFLFVYGIVFAVLGSRFDTNDDMIIQLINYNFWINLAKTQGRIGYLFSGIFGGVPYFYNSIFYFKVIQISTIAFLIVSLIILMNILFRNRLLGYLFGALLILLWQNSIHGHNMLVAYPFGIIFGVILYVISNILLILYLRTKQSWYLIVSLVFWFIDLLFGEYWLCYLPIIIAIIIIEYRNKSIPDLLMSFRTFSWYLLVTIIYLVSYWIYRHYNPSIYVGNSDLSFNPGQIVRVIITYSLGLFPGIQFLINLKMGLITSNSMLNINALTVSIILFVVLLWLKNNVFIRKNGLKYSMLYLSIILYAIIAPNILLSITEKYQGWINVGSTNYLYSSLSFFAIVFLITIVLSYCARWNIVYISGAIVLSIIAYAVQINNTMVAEKQANEASKWILVDSFLQSQSYNETNKFRKISAPTLWNWNLYQPDYWSRYFKYKTGKEITVEQTAEAKDELIYNEGNIQGEGFLMFVKDSVVRTIFVQSKYINKNNPYYFLSVAHNENFNNDLLDNNGIFSSPCGPMRSLILSKGERIKGVTVYNINQKITLNQVICFTKSNPANFHQPVVNYLSGFYDLEMNENSKWRWAYGDSKISINSICNRRVNIVFNMNLISTGNLTIKINDSAKSYIFDGAIAKEIVIEADLIEGNNILTLESNIKPLKLNPNDPRIFSYQLNSFYINEIANCK